MLLADLAEVLDDPDAVGVLDAQVELRLKVVGELEPVAVLFGERLRSAAAIDQRGHRRDIRDHTNNHR